MIPVAFGSRPGRWGPDEARRWLTALARLLDRRGTYDLAWWELSLLGRGPRLAVGLAIVLLITLAVDLNGGLSPRFFQADLVIGAWTALTGVATLAITWWAGWTRPRQVVLRWDRTLLRSVLSQLGPGLLVGLGVGLVLGVLFGLMLNLFTGLAPLDVTFLALSLLYALPWGLVQGLMWSLVVGLGAGLARVSDREPAPDVSLRGDRAAALLQAGIGGVVACLVLGLLAGNLATGLRWAVLMAPIAVLGGRWPWYQFARARLAFRGQLPWRTLDFLTEAHRRGVLRQVGTVYQFRHARLQDRLARS
jgi:MFS family permease